MGVLSIIMIGGSAVMTSEEVPLPRNDSVRAQDHYSGLPASEHREHLENGERAERRAKLSVRIAWSKEISTAWRSYLIAIRQA